MLLGIGLLGCTSGNSPTGNSSTGGTSDADSSGGYTIVIQNFVYLPSNIDVPAGEIIRVMNNDVEAHSATSESQLGDYTLGAVNRVQFDTGPIKSNASAEITLPATVPPGTVIPYFCSIHKAMMAQGTVTIQ